MPQARRRNRNAVGGAAAEPVTLTEVKDQLRVIGSDEDDLLNRLIIAATDYTENVTQRALIEGTVDLYADRFPLRCDIPINIPLPPLISVTSIKYFDNQGIEQTWSNTLYTVDTDQDYCALVYPNQNQSYPSVRDFPKAVHIEYQAGYAATVVSPADLANNVPDEIKQAILMLIGHWHENREASTAGIVLNTVKLAFNALVANYKVRGC